MGQEAGQSQVMRELDHSSETPPAPSGPVALMNLCTGRLVTSTAANLSER